uniref:Protein kinase domain-containing protein n=1 Tax=Oryza meridionalis TaxID=40149 RepID=A0A0E0DP13_9ORYZ
MRFEIILGIARGLTYLHEESSVRIVHRDIKASNILLDIDLTPKISDFGLGKSYDENQSHVSTGIAGTIGYLAPEYAMRGRLTEKADVFAFGVVMLETIAGRPNTDNSLEESKIYLFEWVWGLYEKDQALGIVEPSLMDFDKDEVFRVICVALLCTQGSPHQRPPMSKVVAMLTSDVDVVKVVTKPSYITEWQLRGGGNCSYKGSTNPEFDRQKEITKDCLMNSNRGAKGGGRCSRRQEEPAEDGGESHGAPSEARVAVESKTVFAVVGSISRPGGTVKVARTVSATVSIEREKEMRSCGIRGVIRQHLAWLVLILWSWRLLRINKHQKLIQSKRMSSQTQRHSITTALGRLDLAAQPRLDLPPPPPAAFWKVEKTRARGRKRRNSCCAARMAPTSSPSTPSPKHMATLSANSAAYRQHDEQSGAKKAAWVVSPNGQVKRQMAVEAARGEGAAAGAGEEEEKRIDLAVLHCPLCLLPSCSSNPSDILLLVVVLSFDSARLVAISWRAVRGGALGVQQLPWRRPGKQCNACGGAAKILCPNDLFGCWSYVAGHQRACPHAPCSCSEPRCDFLGSPPMLLSHLVADMWLVSI